MKIDKLKWKKAGTWLVSVLVAAMVLAGLFLSWLGTLVNCETNDAGEDAADTLCTCPMVQISLQPLGNFTQEEALRLKKDLEQHLVPLMTDVGTTIDVLPNKPLADSLQNDAHTRYRADKIIRSLEKDANGQHVIVGLTHKDISVSYKGHEDWGVLGLSLMPKKACVVSTYRVKNRKDMWKVVSHEFIHTYFQYHHCPKDVPTCIMKDANGHADFSNKNGLCETCQKELLQCI